ncbi:MAG: PASTA domain-containing protein [Bacteroidota bacterium]
MLLKEQPFLASTRIPVSKNGHAGDLINVFESLSIPTSVQTEAPWVITMTGTDKVEVQPRKVFASEVPNVLGMNAQDAIFLLENNGLVVRLNGRGTIKSQSVPAGTAVQKGQEIILGLAG